MTELQRAEWRLYAGRFMSAKRRMDQDIAAGRQPSRDDQARFDRYTTLGERLLTDIGLI